MGEEREHSRSGKKSFVNVVDLVIAMVVKVASVAAVSIKMVSIKAVLRRVVSAVMMMTVKRASALA